ncbi:MAG: DHA2 family efflux MFS transporter permease subunit [Streptosporangiaceae bacterium]
MLQRVTPKIAVSVVFVAAMFVSIIDTTIVNVALPKIGESFGVPVTGIGAMVTGYLVSMAVVIPASGWLADRFGSRRIFLLALALFTIASALCGIAANEGQLIAFRVLQGVGGGMLTPVGMAMLLRVYPPAERLRANQILMIPTALAPASGPVLGGLMVDSVGWRWVFFINVPIGIIAFVFGAFTLPEHREPDAGRFDLAGFVLAGAGFSGLMYALSEGSSLGWGSARILTTGLGGLVLLVVLVVVELRITQPMINLRLYRDRLFRTINVASILSTGGFMGVLFLVPLYLQAAHGYSALSAGLFTFPEAVGVMIGSQLVPRIYRRVGPRRMMSTALVAVAVLIATIGLAPLATVPVLMFLLGYAMSHVFMPSQTAAFATISKALTGQASTLFSAQRQLGSAMAIAIVSTTLAILGVVRPGTGLPDLSSYQAAFGVAGFLSFLGALLALRIPDSDAAPTMVAPTPKVVVTAVEAAA